MASTSSSSQASSRLRNPPSAFSLRDSKRNSNFFRPRHPDPISEAIFHERAPVFLNSERLYHAAAVSQPTRHVILVLGEPSLEDVTPLLNSERLAFSLLIIASHQPPLISPMVQPTIRILRLAEPLALEKFGAIRLISVLEWAERVARTWRKLGGIGVEELAEGDQDGFGAQVPPDRDIRSHSENNPSPPVPSLSRPVSFISTISASSLDKLHLSMRRQHRTERLVPEIDPSQRAFDALVNYLPPNVSEKSLLKISILVATASRPYLVVITPLPPGHPQSLNFRRKTAYSMSPTPLSSEDLPNSLFRGPPCPHAPFTKAHLVHLLPTRPQNSVADRLLDSIERFLLSFSYRLSPEKANVYPMESVHASLLDSTAFAEPVGTPPSLSINWTVADMILSGCLDDLPTPRVWFSGASDIVVAALPPSQPSPTLPPVVYCDRCASSSSATLPDTSHPSLKPLSTPPDSEEGMSHCYGLFVKKRLVEPFLRWKLWNRPTAAPVQR